MSGKERRLKRIFSRNGKALIVPMDHGITMGPIQGIEDMKSAVKKICASNIDGIILHKGMAEKVVNELPADKVLGIHLNGSTNLGSVYKSKSMVCSVEDALYYGADFVSYQLNLGKEDENLYFSEIEKIKSHCTRLGIPLLGMVYVVMNEEKNFLHSIRVAEELGFDIVKVSCPNDLSVLKKAVKISSIPILVAGGEMISEELFMKKIHEICETNVAGFAMGRNIFGHTESTKLISKICNTVFEGGGNTL